MQLMSKFNKGIHFLLCVIDIYSKYGFVIPLKDKRDTTITNVFQKILVESGRNPNEVWVEKDSKFYSRSIKYWLEDNAIEMYSTHNEGKSVVAERSIRTSKNKIYKHMTSVSKDMYIDKLDEIVNKYSNTYHRTIKMKPTNIKDNTCIDFDKKYQKIKHETS